MKKMRMQEERGVGGGGRLLVIIITILKSLFIPVCCASQRIGINTDAFGVRPGQVGAF